MRILGIETSCDDTGVAIYDSINGIIFNKLVNQSTINDHYGGIVPELAARKHLIVLPHLIKQALHFNNISKGCINAIAYTAGPGLAGSLLVGASLGSALAFSLNIPTIIVNHMEGHLLTPMLENNKPKFPFLALLVSGGHTQLINAHDWGVYTLLGESLDDSVGEAFDKVAKLLGLKYPGGPNLSQLATFGIKNKFVFPRPMINHSGFNFSFSGLKTYVANFIKKLDDNFQNRADIAKEFENSVVDILVNKCKKALIKLNYVNLVVSGGVSANYQLRRRINKMVCKYGKKVFYSNLELCTDNAAMIAYVGMLRFEQSRTINNLKISIYPRWLITDLNKI